MHSTGVQSLIESGTLELVRVNSRSDYVSNSEMFRVMNMFITLISSFTFCQQIDFSFREIRVRLPNNSTNEVQLKTVNV